MVVAFQIFYRKLLGDSSYILSLCQLLPQLALLKPPGQAVGRDTTDFHSVETKNQIKPKKTPNQTTPHKKAPTPQTPPNHQKTRTRRTTKKITEVPAFVVTFLAVRRQGKGRCSVSKSALTSCNQAQDLLWSSCSGKCYWVDQAKCIVVSAALKPGKLSVHSNTLSHKVLEPFGIFSPTKISIF